MSAAVDELALPEQEVRELTGYERPGNQLKVLKSLGIPARRRPDNTILVLRMHLMTPTQQQAANDAPKRKSAKK
jgi:hypothetical protein